ncbi:MAG: ATP-dependent RecD-like DNA helicase [Deltaproteobacteria bacterium]|jgi:exodeoxyribonuclease V alpha subunit|nr:ATP-dependent RecD-like DNA helicase [Deltaproteobacteria bacterium]
MTAPETLSGQIEKITFHNPENGYAVIQLKVKGQAQYVTCVGSLGSPVQGEILDMTGRFLNHPKFGRQFEIQSFEARPPSTVKGLARYLGSGLIHGIGPVLAKRMVDMFGEKILDVLDSEPERLTEVPGLGFNKREAVINAWRESRGLRRLLMFLANFGLGPNMATKIMRRLGPGAEDLIRKDPYRLAYEVDGVGFKSADRVAKALGWPEDSPERFEAALLYALTESTRFGHTFLPSDELIKTTGQLISQTNKADLKAAVGRIVLAGRAVPLSQSTPGNKDIYLPRYYRSEVWTARELLALSAVRPLVTVPRPVKAVAWAEKVMGLTLSPDQMEAVNAAITAKAVIITGGPGTGKTTITKAICRIWQAVTPRIALCAPTGRAAKRLSQATGLVATTIHRLLEYSPHAGGFARGPGNHLELDMLLVDEASMLDVLLANQLLGALPGTATLILVGDRDQLPPVGPGRVLGDILDSGQFPVCSLRTVYRQAETSLITEAAHLINQGISPAELPQGPAADFHFVEEDNPKKIKDKIIRLVSDRIPYKLGVNPKTDIQVLSPVRQGELGTLALNTVLGQVLNTRPGPSFNHFGQTFRVGDRVIQLRNNYNRDVYNGDLGLITRLDTEGQYLEVEFDERKSAYYVSELDELLPAWCLTVHKAQGSEFPVVVMPLFNGHCHMLRRKLLYTAVSRGKKMVMLVGSKNALNKAVSDATENLRHSNLTAFLKKGPPPVNLASGLTGVLDDFL